MADKHTFVYTMPQMSHHKNQKRHVYLLAIQNIG